MKAAREYTRRNLPISTIVIDCERSFLRKLCSCSGSSLECRCASDLHWEHFGDFALNPKCWPDPAAMVKELDSMGIRAMISVWPFVQGGSVYGHDYNASGPSVNFEPMHAQVRPSL